MKTTSAKLNRIFNPKTVAVIGAKPEEKSVGWGLIKNLLAGKSERKIFAVNPNYTEVLGVKCVSSINFIQDDIDLAIIAVPAKIVPNVIKECCEKKVGGIIVISSGFGESGKTGRILEKEIVKLTEAADIPLIGPNCLGIIRPANHLNATFAPAMPKNGEIAFLSQSGALIDSVIDENLKENYGFSALISYGNEAGVTLADFLKWAANDEQTKVIALYLEGVKDGREIINVFKEVSAKKPIIVVKAGRTKAGREAVASHTGSLAGDYRVYQALFGQTGVIETDTIRELFGLAKALSWQPKCKNGIGIITNGGSCGVLLADYCQALGVKLTPLSKKTLDKLAVPGVMHPAYSKRNPLDVVGDALSDKYKAAADTLLEQPDIHGLIVVQTLQIMTDPEKNAKIIIEAKNRFKEKPIVAAFLGGAVTEPGAKLLEENHIPNYSDLKGAASAMNALIKKNSLKP
ncbi:MAG: CoA-binding protein [Candidatus Nealsonbacteria bacterium]|nr:CoA-binding protein [Candidatus Nealsonbacteria bacterium]